MKRALFMLAVSFFAFSTLALADRANAQERKPYQVAQARLDLFIDSRGRRFLVDPRSGEVVGRANRNARFTRRDKARAQKALRRYRRQSRLENRLGDFFGFRRNNGRYQKGRGGTGVRVEQPRPVAPVQQEQEVAALPEFQQPVESSKTFRSIPKPKYKKTDMARLQVFLDREGFSPGAIDGRWGSNVSKAVAAWKEGSGSDANLGSKDILNQYVNQTGGEVFTTYVITEEDAYGPYIDSVPHDYAEKAQLEELSYTSVYEKLAEKFHMSQAYLRELNKGKNFRTPGTEIKVVATGEKVTEKVHYIVADKGRKQVRGYDRNGRLVAAYPATIGSSDTPSPTGTHSVERIALNPEYGYNPKKNFQQGENDKYLRIPPGPNGPVGSVWIALSKPTYGIHGTPNPETIGKTNSHGCIRLTNWDAEELAKLVRKGVTVEFVE